MHLGAGYDLGAQNAFATLTGNNSVNGKEVVASGTWFQRGNHVRTEAVVKIDGRSSLWGTCVPTQALPTPVKSLLVPCQSDKHCSLGEVVVCNCCVSLVDRFLLWVALKHARHCALLY